MCNLKILLRYTMHFNSYILHFSSSDSFLLLYTSSSSLILNHHSLLFEFCIVILLYTIVNILNFFSATFMNKKELSNQSFLFFLLWPLYQYLKVAGVYHSALNFPHFRAISLISDYLCFTTPISVVLHHSLWVCYVA